MDEDRLAELVEPLFQSDLETDIDDGVVVVTIPGPAGSPYAGHSFRFRLDLPAGFPQDRPRIFALTPIVHPNVHPEMANEVCLAIAAPGSWNGQETHLGNVAASLQEALVRPEGDAAPGWEAKARAALA